MNDDMQPKYRLSTLVSTVSLGKIKHPISSVEAATAIKLRRNEVYTELHLLEKFGGKFLTISEIWPAEVENFSQKQGPLGSKPCFLGKFQTSAGQISETVRNFFCTFLQ